MVCIVFGKMEYCFYIKFVNVIYLFMVVLTELVMC